MDVSLKFERRAANGAVLQSRCIEDALSHIDLVEKRSLADASDKCDAMTVVPVNSQLHSECGETTNKCIATRTPTENSTTDKALNAHGACKSEYNNGRHVLCIV